jgi:hypothetical protein
MAAIQKITDDLIPFYPKTILLFGSMSRYLAGQRDKFPNDIDLMMAGNNVPFDIQSKDYGADIELHVFKIYEMEDIAQILRYDVKTLALSRLYSRNVIKSHSRDVIAACLMLGPAYVDFGFEQIEIDGIVDKRDYSIHRVLYGEVWWSHLCEYARERRGPVRRFSDKMIYRYEFDQWEKIMYSR